MARAKSTARADHPDVAAAARLVDEVLSHADPSAALNAVLHRNAVPHVGEKQGQAKTPRQIADRIEAQRTRLFRAQALVRVTLESLDPDEEFARRQTLVVADELLDDIAGYLNEISGV